MCDICVSLNYVNSDNKYHLLLCSVIYTPYICIIRNEVITIKTYKIMKASVMKQRIVEKFILSEFVQGNLDTREAVSSMLLLIQKKLGLSAEQAGEFLRNAIGINA